MRSFTQSGCSRIRLRRVMSVGLERVVAGRLSESGTPMTLEQLRQGLEDLELDLSIAVHNALAEEQGNARMPRRGEV